MDAVSWSSSDADARRSLNGRSCHRRRMSAYRLADALGSQKVVRTADLHWCSTSAAAFPRLQPLQSKGPTSSFFFVSTEHPDRLTPSFLRKARTLRSMRRKLRVAVRSCSVGTKKTELVGPLDCNGCSRGSAAAEVEHQCSSADRMAFCDLRASARRRALMRRP